MKTSQITASVFVECLLSLSFFAPGVLSAQAYTPLKAEIPVFCQEVADPEVQVYQITIRPENEMTPVPDSGTLEVAENSTGRFEIEITEPGTYRYQIAETAGSVSGVQYDERVYEVTVFVENGPEDTLVCAVTAGIAGSDEKAGQILFQNIAEAVTEPAETTETVTETVTVTTETVTTAVTSTVTQPANQIVSIINSIKTGDSFPVYALCLGICAVLTAFLFRRRHAGKEGGK